MTRIIGIDPGLKGGIVELTEGQVTNRMPMPLDDDAGIDFVAVTAFLRERKPSMVVIERQQSMPKQGVASTFTTGMNFGVLVGICFGLGITLEIVRAKEWQKTLLFQAVEDTKKRSIASAIWRWPGVEWKATERSKKDHDGMTDAANIAWHGWVCHLRDVAYDA